MTIIENKRNNECHLSKPNPNLLNLNISVPPTLNFWCNELKKKTPCFEKYHHFKSHRSWSQVWSATEKGWTLKAWLMEFIWSRVTCGLPWSWTGLPGQVRGRLAHGGPWRGGRPSSTGCVVWHVTVLRVWQPLAGWHLLQTSVLSVQL